MGLSVTGYGTRLVPREPCVLSFPPPKLLVEHDDKAVVFGEHAGALGASPLGGASVDDVIEELGEYPNVPLFALSTEDYGFPVIERVKVFSTDDDWPFELTLEDAEEPDEVLHIRGPLDAALDLAGAMRGTEVVGNGTVEKDNGRARWSEHAYEIDGAPWRQRLYAVTLFSTQKLGVEHHYVLTAQCPAGRAKAVFGLADRIAGDLGSVR